MALPGVRSPSLRHSVQDSGTHPVDELSVQGRAGRRKGSVREAAGEAPRTCQYFPGRGDLFGACSGGRGEAARSGALVLPQGR